MAAVDEYLGTIASPQDRNLAEVKTGFTHFCEGDVIFAKITPCMQNGKAAIARGLHNGIGFGSTEFHVLRPTSKVIAEWVWYFVRQQGFRNSAMSNFKGTAGQQRVPVDWLAQQQIPVPPLPEQRRIVDRIQELMSRADEIRRLREENLTAANALLGASLSSLFSSGGPTHALGDVTTDIRNGWSGKEEESASPSRVLRLSAVHGMTIRPDESREVRIRPSARVAFAVKAGDVFVVRGNGSRHLVGRSAIADQDLEGTIFNDLLIRVTPKEGVLLPEFLNLCLHAPEVRTQLEETARTAAGIWKINQGGLGKIRISCPTLDRQARLVQTARDLLGACRTLISESSDNAISLLPNAILRKAFAGEL